MSLIKRSLLPKTKSAPYQRLTILIIAPCQFTEMLKAAVLGENQRKYEDRLQFYFCEDTEEMVSWVKENNVSPDYIFVVADLKNRSCLHWVEENLKSLDDSYLNAGRVCLVNGTCSIKPSALGVPLGHINILSQKYSIMLINGDVEIPDKCQLLASRFLQLATSVCGFFSGVPLVLDIPGHLAT